MLKKIISILSNPILFYADKDGNSVFRNYCLFEGTGNLYRKEFPKKDVGKTLEYRFGLDKYLKAANILVPVIIYFVLIHFRLTFWNILLSEILWIISVSFVRLICSYKYSMHLLRKFGKYETVNFKTPVSQEKKAEYRSNFYSKIIITAVILILFFTPALLLKGVMKLCLNAKTPKFKAAINISKVYNTFYPYCENVYDMRAYAKYMTNDLTGALEDYQKVLDKSSKKFGKRDLSRFANLLYLEKNLSSPEDAIVMFNDYITRKKLSVFDESKILWLKSIFSIENNMPDMIVQDYNDLLSSLSPKDKRNNFYITCDKAYIMYLMGEYVSALKEYDRAIAFAQENSKEFSQDLKTLYAERAFVKRQLGDMLGAENDFVKSGIDIYYDMDKYEPSYRNQTFLKDY